MKRYTVKLDAYIPARNDREAMIKAAKLAAYIRELYGNDCQVLELEETPIGSANFREVHKGRLTLLENKLVEA